MTRRRWKSPAAEAEADRIVLEADATVARIIALAETGAREEAHRLVTDVAHQLRRGVPVDVLGARLRNAGDRFTDLAAAIAEARATLEVPE